MRPTGICLECVAQVMKMRTWTEIRQLVHAFVPRPTDLVLVKDRIPITEEEPIQADDIGAHDFLEDGYEVSMDRNAFPVLLFHVRRGEVDHALRKVDLSSGHTKDFSPTHTRVISCLHYRAEPLWHCRRYYMEIFE